MDATPARARPSQAERVAASREALLDAAAALFVERGYHATSANDIAERAGYSREMVRVRFGSKLGVAQRLVRVDYQQAIHVEPDPAESGLAVLAARADQLASIGTRASLRVRAAFVLGFESATSVPELEDAFAPWLAEAESQFGTDLRRGMRDGSIRTVDPRRTARLLLDAAVGGAYAALRSGDAVDAAASFRAVLDLIRA